MQTRTVDYTKARAHTGEFECQSRRTKPPLRRVQSTLFANPSPETTSKVSPRSPSKKDGSTPEKRIRPGLKRANTSHFRKGDTSGQKSKSRNLRNLDIASYKSMQKERALKTQSSEVVNYMKKIEKKRGLFGNDVQAKEESLKRRGRHRAQMKCLEEIRQAGRQRIAAADPDDTLESDDDVMSDTSESIHFPGLVEFSELMKFDKTYNSRNTVQSPFKPRNYCPRFRYGATTLMDDVITPQESDEEDDEVYGPLNFGSMDSVSCGSDSAATTDDGDLFSTCSSMKRSDSLKFVDEMFKFDSRSSIIETSLTIPDEPEYDGNPKIDNYFGEKARTKFFMLYNTLSKKFESGGGDTPVLKGIGSSGNSRPGSSPLQSGRPVSGRPASGQRRRPISALASRSNPVSGARPHSSGNQRSNIMALAQLQQLNASPSSRAFLRLDTDFDDDDDDDDLVFEDESPKRIPLTSPRHRFLKLIIKDGKVAPLPIIIRHSPDDDELNLAHRSLGDDYIIYLSAVVQDLPNLCKINLRDNRLTDRGMGKFIHTLASQQQITSVDISENKIDSKSAEALTHFLKRSNCTLQVLKMSNADLDDDEVAIFMDALEVNQSIVEMDLSHNKLGGIGEKSVKTKQGGRLSGGAAVAHALGANSTLQSLNLSWNKLGLATAVHLGKAIFYNSTLLELNLAYNNVKDDGAEAIGSALSANSALTSVDISYNGIGTIGAFVVATGLRLGSCLKVLNMSGNPLGHVGGVALLQTLNYHSIEREIILKECTFGEESVSMGMSSRPNMTYPNGKYTLDLARPRDKCTALELYRLASVRRGYSFKSIEYQNAPQIGYENRQTFNSKKFNIKLYRPNNPAVHRGQPYGSWRKAERREPHKYTFMEAEEWMAVEEELFLHDCGTNQKWDIPNAGKLTVDFSYAPRCATPIDCLNATGLKRLIKMLVDHPKECMNILKLCRNLVLESHQVNEIINAMGDTSKAKDKLEIMAYLLLCVRDTSNTSVLFSNHLNMLVALKDIHQVMRSMFYISVNAFSGHYSLDLDNPLDRLAGVRLMEISADENAYIRRAMPSWNTPNNGYTAQKQNRTNFRNERYRRMVIERGCSDEFFSRGLEDKTHGVFEFDFVSIARPAEDCFAINDDHLMHLLVLRGLYNAASAPIQSIRRGRRKTRHVVPSFGDFDDHNRDNPFTLEPAVVENKKELGGPSHSMPALTTEVDCGVIPEKTNGPDPSKILGHFIVRNEVRFVPSVLPCQTEDIRNQLMTEYSDFYLSLKDDDVNTITSDVNSDTAMYFMEAVPDRFIVYLCIRILSNNQDHLLETISCIRKNDGGAYELFGQGKPDDSDRPTKPATINEILNLTGETASQFTIGTLQHPNPSSLNPTHKRYVINDDIYMIGSEVIVRLKCSDWSKEGVANRSRDVCSKLFGPLGVYANTVRMVNHRTTDTKSAEFLSYKFAGSVNSHVVLQQVDVCVEGIPQDPNFLVKSYINSGKGSTPDDATAVINTLWRWRMRNSSDRGNPKVDLNTFPYDFWGFKFLQLRTLIGSLWITAKQAARIVAEFPQFGYDAQPHRESAILCVFSRIVDIENMETVMKTLPQTNHAAVYDRVGWQNAINVWDIDKLFIINLSYDDSRNIAIMLGKFAAVEPGENFLYPRYRRSLVDMFIAGWDLPTSWTIDPDKAKSWDGVPRKGQVIVTYCSSPETGCKVNPAIRKQFRDRYFLMAVPRGHGEDLYLQDTDPSDWE